MEAVRIVLTQSIANYKREETVDNKMTYPLPPPSTVIGAIHKACGYTLYHPMDVAIQGEFNSLQKRTYTDHCFLNSTHDDRSILVKLNNPNSYSKAFDVVAKPEKNQGNSFENEVTITVCDRKLLTEYQNLKKMSKELELEKKTIVDVREKELKDLIKQLNIEKKALKQELKTQEKNSDNYKIIQTKLGVLVSEIESYREKSKFLMAAFREKKKTLHEIPYSYFKSLTTSIKHYEVLTEVTLILYIKAEKEILSDILDNVYNIKSIGRSEDFVDIKEAKLVTLATEVDDEVDALYSAYLGYDLCMENTICCLGKMSNTQGGEIKVQGVKYNLNKDYSMVKNKRIFNKVKCVYTSNYFVDEEESGENLFFDTDFNSKTLIVNFL